MALSCRTLKEIEDKILQVLSESDENILEDQTAITILGSSKNLSDEIQAKQTAAEISQQSIDSARRTYEHAAITASSLFFAIGRF